MKDSNNILPHELWVPDYLEKVPFVTVGDFRLLANTSDGYTYSDNYSSMGEYSILQKVQSNEFIELRANCNTNKSYTIKCDIYTNVNIVFYAIAKNTSTNTIVKTINIPTGNNLLPSIIINSNEFVGDENRLFFRIMPIQNNGVVYIDNLILLEQ